MWASTSHGNSVGVPRPPRVIGSKVSKARLAMLSNLFCSQQPRVQMASFDSKGVTVEVASLEVTSHPSRITTGETIREYSLEEPRMENSI